MGQYDILLRHVARRYSHDMAVGLLPTAPIRAVRWIDTQLTALIERRADKALELDLEDHRAWLKVEFAVDPRRAVLGRMFEYTALLAVAQLAAEADARRARRRAGGRADARAVARVATRRPPVRARLGADPHVEEDALVEPVDAVLFVLRGRKRRWPGHGCYRISPPGSPFSGLRFRIEAVYQRTVQELCARPGTFWLVFTCLAVDANMESMRHVIDEIRRREPCEEDRSALYFALWTLAELDPWGHGLREEIKMLVQKLDMETAMKSESLRELFQLAREDGLEEGEKKGERKGEKKGEKKGERKGVRKGVRKGRAQLTEELLRDQLVRHLRRELTDAEQKLLAARAGALSALELRDLLTDTTPDALRLRLFGAEPA